jgi:hypothetical protein
VGPVIPPVPGLQFQLESFAGKVKALGVVWLVYAALSLMLGIAGLTFAQAFFSHHFGPWGHGPWSYGPGPEFFGPALFHFVWVILLLRSGLALAAGLGLLERAPWGRIVAIVAAFLSLLKFPFGTAIGIWTLVVLMGYRSTSLYEQLP